MVIGLRRRVVWAKVSIHHGNREHRYREDAVPLAQVQLVAAVADRAQLSKADAKRARRGRARRTGQRAEGPYWRTCPADGACQAGSEEAQGPQSGHRRGDRHCCQTGERGSPCSAIGESQERAAIGPEGASPPQRAELSDDRELDRRPRDTLGTRLGLAWGGGPYGRSRR